MSVKKKMPDVIINFMGLIIVMRSSMTLLLILLN